MLIALTTALLNLDTSVAFLTPILVHTARSRGERDAPLLYGCILLSNAGSLFLPGSNLTNLLVLGHLHVTGGEFLAHMWLPALGAWFVTAGVIGITQHRSLRLGADAVGAPPRLVLGLGMAAIIAATVLVLTLRSPAIPVLVVGVGAVGLRMLGGRAQARDVFDVLGLPVLVGLFGFAVALGTLGRLWSGPTKLMAGLDPIGAAFTAAISSLVLNNLPAAALFAARAASHPYALLIGLNLGPNLFVTGSLAWFIWLRTAHRAGARPSVAAASGIGAIAVPLSIAVAVGLLVLEGPR